MLKNIYIKFIQSEFWMNVATLSFGTLIAQVIVFGTAPVITRLFTPANFGVLAVFLSITEMVSIVASLTYERAIILPESQEEARDVFTLCAISLVLVSLISLGVFGFWQSYWIRVFNTPLLKPYLLLVPVAVFIKGLNNISVYLLIRSKKFKSIASASVVRTVWDIGVKILIGTLVGAITGGLIGGTITGMVTGVIFMIVAIRKQKLLQGFRGTSGIALKTVMVRYRKFPLYLSWITIINTISKELVVFLFAYLFTPEVVGFYYLAKRMIRKPINLVGDSINKVYFQKAAEQRAHQIGMLHDLKHATGILLLVSIVPFTLLTIYGKPLFSFVFGAEWGDAGLYAQIMSPWLFLIFVNRPANAIFVVLEKLKILLIYNILLTVFRCGAIVIGYWIGHSPIVSLALFSGVSIVFNAIYLFMAFYWAGRTTLSPVMPEADESGREDHT